MNRVAVVENASLGFKIQSHAQRAEEIPSHIQRTILSFNIHNASEHYRSERKCESKRTTPKMVIDDHQRYAENDCNRHDLADVIPSHKKRQRDRDNACTCR